MLKFKTPAVTMTALAAALCCAPAFAQSTERPEMLERVEVTGSHIKRTSKEGPSPVDIISAKEIAATGAKTVLELMKTVPGMGADGFNDTPTQNGFSRGVATASLRNLSSTSTLVLLNGRRMTPAAYANPNNGTSTLYDLNTIPLSAIERVEILKDGASAVYGSDAIGGVINFILKKDYEGLMLAARYGANDDREFDKKNVNATFGMGNFDTDGYNFFLSGDLTKRGRTSMADGSNDIHAEDYNAINVRQFPGAGVFSKYAVITRESGAPGSLNFSQANAANVNINTSCDSSRLLTGSAANGFTAAPFGNRQFCFFDTNAFNEAQTAGTDLSLLGRGTIKLSNALTGFVEFGFSKSDRYYTGAGRTIDGRSTTNGAMFTNNGLTPAPFRAILPIGHPDNPFPTSRAAVAYRFENLNSDTDLTNKQYRGLAGVQGSFGSWDFETAVLWNKTERDEFRNGFLNVDVMGQLVNGGRTLASIAADPNIAPVVHNTGEAAILQWDAKVTTEFGRLPGGPIGFAAGVELRRESITITPDARNAAGKVLGLANTLLDGSRDVKSAYVELRTPFFKGLEAEWAGRVDKYPTLKANFVPKVGLKYTPSDILALRGTFAKGFRAPALSQVAPGGAQFFETGLVDPVRCGEDGNPRPGAELADCNKTAAGVGTSNPNLKPEHSKSLTFGLVLSPNSSLDILLDWYRIKKTDEVALLSGQTVLDHPNQYPGLIVRDTNPSTLLNGVAGTGPILQVSDPWTNQGGTTVTGVDFTVKGRFTYDTSIKVTPYVTGAYTLSYRREEVPGYPTINVVGTNGGLADWATSVGAIPRLKLRMGSGFETGNHSLNLAMNFVSAISQKRYFDGSQEPPAVFSGNTCHWGGTNFDGPTLVGRTLLGVAPTATNGRDLYLNRYPDCTVPAWTTFDVAYSYTGFKDLTLGFSIQNITDEKAPYQPGSNTSTAVVDGFNSGLHSNTGRYFNVSVSYKFK